MDQGEFTSIFCIRPQNFAWFLGAGASRSSGLPTATDIIWDLKRRYYCREENQDVSRQDIQNEAVRARIQYYMDSKGFPAQWAEDEYTAYFEKIFGEDKDRQRKYLKGILSEEHVTLSVGNRVLGAMLSSGLSRIAFTTNFDSVVEKALAEVSGQSLSAYHLEGSHTANQALNNEEFPIYCKLHGDFRYDSLKNLSVDLATQNAALSDCLINAGTRFGFIVAGYSGRDRSVMGLFHAVLESKNPFPHGLFWMGIKGSEIPPVIDDLLNKARSKGINAHYVPIETFDALMLRLWRNTESKTSKLDTQVRKSHIASVNIPLPKGGIAKPILRLNALPVIGVPRQCMQLLFSKSKNWDELRQARNDTQGQLILTKTDVVLCWGERGTVDGVFKDDLLSAEPYDLPENISAPESLHIKGFIEEALCSALARGRPLLARTTRASSFLIADPHAEDQGGLDPLFEIVGKESGTITGLFAPVTEDQSTPEQVTWAEAVRVSVDYKDRKVWLLIDPDIWIWPQRARKVAAQFMERRRSDRYNKKYNDLLDAWVRVILDTDQRDTEVSLSAFDHGSNLENPVFRIRSRTAFSRRQAT
ncbi:MAG: SIR2 family protein [Candidatus Thiodiazotropha sp. (ex Codakia orbicularis)]|nr:SIR2 family protein [Candidatus Thiodiazotropha sp. (ex Codakia orbicularis)]